MLDERNYEYDCSLLPTYLAPLARAFYMYKSRGLSADERERLGGLYGKFSDGFRTLRPHLITGTRLVELPVTTFPIVKAPIHVSYLMYVLSFSEAAARAYWKAALAACRLTSTGPSLLLHPLDFLSGEEIDELKFFPGMNVHSAKKIEFVGQVIESMCRDFEVVTVREHARTVISAVPADQQVLESHEPNTTRTPANA